MTNETQSDPAAGTANPILTAYLADRDEPCPVCGYNLRGGTSPICPECGAEIRLAVQWANVKYRWWILTLIGIILPIGACVGLALFIAILMCVEGVRESEVVVMVWNLCMLILPTIALVGILKKRVRFLRSPPARQRVYTCVSVVCGVTYLGVGWAWMFYVLYRL